MGLSGPIVCFFPRETTPGAFRTQIHARTRPFGAPRPVGVLRPAATGGDLVAFLEDGGWNLPRLGLLPFAPQILGKRVRHQTLEGGRHVAADDLIVLDVDGFEDRLVERSAIDVLGPHVVILSRCQQAKTLT